MRLVSWMSERRWIVRPIAFWWIVVLLGPPISGVTIGLLMFVAGLAFGQPISLAVVPLLLFGSYFVGVIPAAVSATILVLLRRFSPLEGLIIGIGATFAFGLVWQSLLTHRDANWLLSATYISLLCLPAVIGTALLSLRLAVFREPTATSISP